jgi:hypothetical protein
MSHPKYIGKGDNIDTFFFDKGSFGKFEDGAEYILFKLDNGLSLNEEAYCVHADAIELLRSNNIDCLDSIFKFNGKSGEINGKSGYFANSIYGENSSILNEATIYWLNKENLVDDHKIVERKYNGKNLTLEDLDLDLEQTREIIGGRNESPAGRCQDVYSRMMGRFRR